MRAKVSKNKKRRTDEEGEEDDDKEEVGKIWNYNLNEDSKNYSNRIR